MDTSGPFMKRNADNYRRHRTRLDLDKLGLNLESHEYKVAYKNAKNDIKKEKKKVQSIQKAKPISALTILARIKQAIMQGGVVFK